MFFQVVSTDAVAQSVRLLEQYCGTAAQAVFKTEEYSLRGVRSDSKLKFLSTIQGILDWNILGVQRYLLWV